MRPKSLGGNSVNDDQIKFLINSPPWDFSSGLRNRWSINNLPSQLGKVLGPDSLEVLHSGIDVLFETVRSGLTKFEQLAKQWAPHATLMPIAMSVSWFRGISHELIVLLGQ